jgi:translation initiation factor 5A
MGDEADYAIETADAGASATIPMEAGQIKKGGYVFFLGFWANLEDLVSLDRF